MSSITVSFSTLGPSARKTLSKGTARLLFIGRLVPKKALHTLNAISLLKHSTATFSLTIVARPTGR